MTAAEIAVLQRARAALAPMAALAEPAWMLPPYRRLESVGFGGFTYAEIENARDTVALLDIAPGLISDA